MSDYSLNPMAMDDGFAYRTQIDLLVKQRDAFKARIEQLEAESDISDALLADAKARIEQLEAALKEIIEFGHGSTPGEAFTGDDASLMCDIASRALGEKTVRSSAPSEKHERHSGTCGIRGLCSGDVPMNERLSPEAKAVLDEVRSRLESIDRIPHWDAPHVQGSLEIVMRAIVALDERITKLEAMSAQ